MTDPSARVDAAPLPNPALLMRLALAYRSSMALFAASGLDLFTPLSNGAMSAEDVARACGTQPEPTRMLLDACAAEGLLTRAGDLFANTPIADAYLVKGRPAYIAHGLKFAEDLYPAWGRLADTVRTGRPAMPQETMLGEDKEKTRVQRGLLRAHGINGRGRAGNDRRSASTDICD
jgi:Dimerisation domain